VASRRWTRRTPSVRPVRHWCAIRVLGLRRSGCKPHEIGKPSSGLEPETPSLPWRFASGTGVHGRALEITFRLQIAPSQRVGRARACSRALGLVYPSRTRVALAL
jgi:hypothetical protein